MKVTHTTRGWLKDLRDRNGWTQDDAAKALNIPVTTFASYEQGYRTPSVANAQRYADVLQVDWTIFFGTDVRDSTTKEGMK